MIIDWIKGVLAQISIDKAVSTCLVILIILLKLFINQKVTTLKFKEAVVSVPGEIIFLVLGFLSGSLILSKGHEALLYTLIIISFILLCIIYAIERWVLDKITGKPKWYNILVVVVIYTLAIAFYILVVFGGLY